MCALLLGSSPAFGQLGAARSRRASAEINQTLNTATAGPGFSAFNTLSRYGGYAPPPGGYGSSNTANLQAPAFAIPAAQNVRNGLEQYALGTRGLDRVGDSAMLSLIGRSPTASWFANPTYAAYGGVTPPIAAQFGDPVTSQLVFEPRRLAWQKSLHHAIFEPELLKGGSYHDALTAETLRNPQPMTYAPPSEPQESPAERMAAQLKAARARYLVAGWEYLKAGQYLEARGAFESAHMLAPEDPGPMAGRLLSALADGEWKSAALSLERLSRVTSSWIDPKKSGDAGASGALALPTSVDPSTAGEQKPNLFELTYPLHEKLESPQKIEIILAYLARNLRENPEDEAAAALQVWLLWQNGQASAALQAAERLRVTVRTSQYAKFAEDIRAQMDKPPAEGATEAKPAT